LASPSSARCRRRELLCRDARPGDTGTWSSTSLLHIQPGDTVVFVPTDPGHNVASLDAMIPAGVDHIESAIMGEPMPVTFTRTGVYGLECTRISAWAWSP
jgi:hypothetical protein